MTPAGVVETELPPIEVRKPGGISIKRGFGWTLAAYISVMASQWAMLVVMGRLGAKDQSDMGLFLISLAVVAPFILFSNLNLRRIFATDTAGMFRFRDYFTLRMATNVAAFAGILLFLWIRDYRSEIIWSAVALAGAKMIESTSDILHGYFQERRRIDIGSRATLLRSVLTLAAFITAFLATGQVFWALIALGAASAAVLVGYEWPRAVQFLRSAPRARPAAPVKRNWLRLAKIGLPLGFVALVISFKGNIPIQVIEEAMGTAAAGIFGAVIYFYLGSNRIVAALGEASAERLASLHADGNRAGATYLLKRLFAFNLFVSAIGLGSALLLGGPILRLLYGPTYAGLGGLLVALMAAACVNNLQTLLDYVMMATRRFRIQPWLYGGSGLLLIVLCAWLVPTMGFSGAVLALAIMSGAELIATAAIVFQALYGKRAVAEVCP
jgi:O-antigen/teichoic acid export membrane protein